MRSPVAALCLVALSCGQPAAAADTFHQFTGDWAGRGAMTTRINSPMKRGRCRIAARVPDGQQGTVIFNGRCSVPAGSATLEIRLDDRGGGRVHARVASSALPETLQYSGRRKSRDIDLRSRKSFLVDGIRIMSRISITGDGGNSFVLREWHATEGTRDWRLSTDLKFQRPG